MAERNAEIVLEQEKHLVRNASFRPSLDNSGNTNRENGESISEKDKFVNRIAIDVDETCNHEPLKETMKVDVGEDLDTLKMEKLEEIVCIDQVEDKEKPEEIVSMEEDISSKDLPLRETKKEKDQHIIKKTDNNVRTNHTRSSPKPSQVTKEPVASKVVMSSKTQTSKVKSMIKATANKAVSPVSKASGSSTPRVSKPASTISSLSTSRSSVKKDNVSTLPRKKQTGPHTCLNVDQPRSHPTALATTRKSLIMERMGDKEIVRRAFKSFHKSLDQMKLSEDGQDTAPKQVPTKATSVSKLVATGRRENGRLEKSDGTEKRGSNSHRSSSFVLKSNGTAEKQKIQLSRPGARAVERIHLPAKPKAEVTNAKTRRQSLDPKAKSMGEPLPKVLSDKVL